MKDEDIDFSDCPEISDEMWKKGIWRKGLNSDKTVLAVDREIVEFFKKQDGDYRENINRHLREFVESQMAEKV